LVDGEHYPPVVRAAVERLSERGYEPKAALFLGGTEKADRPYDIGIPMAAGVPEEVLPHLIGRYRPAVVVDLSDEPVLDYRGRMRLAGITLAHDVAYEGADFRFDPPPSPRLTSLPTVSIIGTGKRTGKTALSIQLTRYWKAQGRDVVIVTMGRGGPPDPVVLREGDFEPTAEGLQRLARMGLHAASDYAEDALLTGVTTVGTRRCGGGLAGATGDDNFHLGVSVAEGLRPDLLVYEGSGTAIPPAASDATILVASADLDPEYLRGYFGPYRLLISDALVLIESGPRSNQESLRSIAGELVPHLPVHEGRYEIDPTVTIEGRAVVLATTAPAAAGTRLRQALVETGATEAVTVHSLSNREQLRRDLDRVVDYDVVLTEIKAAAVDVVIPWAEQTGLEIGFLHNRVRVAGGIASVAKIAEKAWSTAPT
jgi:cyclic 2,3-diphosphoglycerate synthetase